MVTWLFRTRPFTLSMSVLVIAAYLLVEVPGGSIGWLLLGKAPAPPGVVLLAVWPQAIENGQYWRLLTGTIVHTGVVHLLLNLLGLLVLGAVAESRFGRSRLAVLFLGSALIGNLAATVTAPESLTLGASGGIMGIAGGLITLMVRYRLERETLVWVIGGVVSTVLNGFLHSGISNAAHIGGVLTGFGLAWFMGAGPAWVQREHRLEEATDTAERRRIGELLVGANAAAPMPEEVLRDPANRLVLRGAGSRRIALYIFGALFFGVALVVAVRAANGLMISLGVLLIAASFLAGFQSVYQKLTLTPVGLRYRSLPWASLRCRWAEVDSFEPYVVTTGFSSVQMVRCHILQRRPTGTRLSKKVIPAFAGMDAERQAAMLEDWRARWTALESR